MTSTCRFIQAQTLLAAAILAGVPAAGQTSRPFMMAASGIQAYADGRNITFRNTGPGFPMSDLAQDVDLINIQPEFLGIPYEKFAAGSQLPDGDPWAQQMSDVAKSARQTGKKLLVQIALVRINLIGNAAYTDGPVQVQASWAPACADLTRPEYAHVAQAYTNYALWIARTFTPEYYVIMLEPNLYYSSCGGNTPTWRYLVKLERDVYRAVKAEFPSMLLFPSFNLEAIYGVNPLAQIFEFCFDRLLLRFGREVIA